MNLLCIMLSEVSQTEEDRCFMAITDTESRKVIPTETESRVVVARGWRMGKRGVVGQRVQTSLVSEIGSGVPNVQRGDYS